MPLWHRALAASLLLLAVPGCSDEEGLPEACRADATTVARALEAAPATVSLNGLRLSECLRKDSSGGEVQVVGTSYVEAASRLAQRGRREPEGRGALQLGYLVGAVHRGTGRTPGIHSELVRRIEQEAATVSSRSRAYRRGLAAGQRRG